MIRANRAAVLLIAAACASSIVSGECTVWNSFAVMSDGLSQVHLHVCMSSACV